MSDGTLPPPPPKPEGQQAYEFAVKTQGQQGADEWKDGYSQYMAREGHKPSEIASYFGDPAPAGAPPAQQPQPLSHFDTHAIAGYDPATGVAKSVDANHLSLLGAMQEGTSASSLGTAGNLIFRDYRMFTGTGGEGLPADQLPEGATIPQKLAYGAAKLAGDLPFMVGGAMGGAPAGPAGAGAGAFGAPAAVRETLMTAYDHSRGAIQTPQQFATHVGNSIKKVANEAAVGGLSTLAGAGTGAVVAKGAEPFLGPLLTKGVSYLSNLTAMYASSLGIETLESGKLPSRSDVEVGAIQTLGLGAALGAAHAGHDAESRVGSNLKETYKQTGIPPMVVADHANEHPILRQEALAQDTQGDPVIPTLRAAAPADPPKPLAEHVKVAGSGGANNDPNWEQDIQPIQRASAIFGNIVPAMERDAAARGTAASEIPALEGAHGDTRVVSKPIPGYTKGGAIGIHQITVANARAYGFGEGMDNAQLTESLKNPDFNTRVFNANMIDLEKRFPGDTAAQLAGYNGGIKRANELVQQGPGTRLEAVPDKSVKGGIRYVRVAADRNEAVLPLETQRYLANGRRLAGGQLPGGEMAMPERTTTTYDAENYDRGEDKPPNSVVNFEVAPDPKGDPGLLSRWNRLSDDEKNEYSEHVVDEMMPRILALHGVEGKVVPQAGGYLDDTNPSFGLQMASSEGMRHVSDTMGHVFSQDSMMNTSNQFHSGSKPETILAIDLGRGMDLKQTKDLYDEMRLPVAGDKEGKPLIDGHTTNLRTGRMEIMTANPEGVKEEIARRFPEYANKITTGTKQVSMVGKADYKIDPAVRNQADALRAEAQESLKRLMAAKEDGTPLPMPTSKAAAVGAASTWENATDEDLEREVLSNVGENTAPKGNVLERVIDQYFSALTPGRALDNSLIKAKKYERIHNTGIEDIMRERYASDTRTSYMLKFGGLDPSGFAKGTEVAPIEGSENDTFVQAMKAVVEDGGTPQGFVAYLMAKRGAALEMVGPEGKVKIDNAKQAKIASDAAKAQAQAAGRALAKLEKKAAALKDPEKAEAIRQSDAYVQVKAASDAANETASAALRQAQYRMKLATPRETGINPFAAAEMIGRDSFAAKYQRGTDRFNAMNDHFLDYLKAAGTHSATQIQAMRDVSDTYVSFRRMIGGKAANIGTGKDGGVYDPLKRFEGDDGKITNPLMARIDNMGIGVKIADRNMAIRFLLDKAEADPSLAAAMDLKRTGTAVDPNDDQITQALKAYGFGKPEGMEEGEEGEEPGWDEEALEKAREAYGPIIAMRQEANMGKNEFLYMRDGKAESWSVADEHLARMIKDASSPLAVDPVSKVVQFISKLDRSGIVINPTFPSRMTLWHQFNEFVADPTHPPPILTLLRGMPHVLGQDALFQKVMANGGFGAALTDMDKQFFKTDADKIFNETNTWNRLWNTFSSPVELAHTISSKLDAANRVGIFIHAKKLGMTDVKAAMTSRKAGIDYAEQAASQIANNMAQDIPFWRPHFLGMKQSWEAFEDQGRGRSVAVASTLAYAISTIQLPAIALYAINRLQDKYLPAERQYANIDRWEKDNAMIFPEVAGYRLKLRLPANFGWLFGGLTVRALDAMVSEDPHNMEGALTDFLNTYIPAVLPPLIQSPLEVMTNKNLTTGRPLIAGSLEKLSPDMQFTEYTSEPAKALAKAMDYGLGWRMSPIQIDHIIDGWTGTLGTDALKAVDAVLQKPGPPSDLADNIFINGFLVRHRDFQRPLDDFYTDMDKIEQAHSDAGSLLKHARTTGYDGDYAAYYKKLDDPKMQSSVGYLMSIAKAITYQRSVIIGLDHNKQIDVDQKRQLTEEAYRQMIASANQGLVYTAQVLGEKPREQINGQ
jgi:hypothetical protein